MPPKRNAMPPKRNAMPLAERNIDGFGWNAIPMPGRGLDAPGAERYATGGTQQRWLQAERYTDARAVASMAPGRNAMPLAERSIDGSGGTLYRCQGRGLDGPGAERYATGGTQHRRLRAERYTDAGTWPRCPRGGTLCHWYW